MKYTVTWTPSAERDLALLWMQAADRQALTAAADAIDLSLRRDPLGEGEARDGTSRILFAEPLAVLYDVQPDDCRVAVWAVGLSHRAAS